MWIKLRTTNALRTIVSMVILYVTFQSINKRTRSKRLGGLCVMSDAVYLLVMLSAIPIRRSAKVHIADLTTTVMIEGNPIVSGQLTNVQVVVGVRILVILPIRL